MCTVAVQVFFDIVRLMNENVIRPPSYVGVSGVVSPEQQSSLESLADGAGLFAMERALVLGVKATHKTQFQDIENKYGPEWYPVGEAAFSGALELGYGGNGLTMGVAQTYLEVEHIGDANYRREFVERLHRRGQPWLQGIQFDMLPWHRNIEMLTFLNEVKGEQGSLIFLQCHKDAMEELGPKGVVRRLGHFAMAIDYILFDASHGTGARMDTMRLGNFLEEAYSSSRLGDVGMAIAGGLDGTTVREELPPLVTQYPDVSWDAEGRLHPKNSHGKQPLNIRLVREYLQASADVLSEAA